MNWKKEAENDLRSYMRRKDSLQNIQDKIASLDDRMQSIRGGMSDATPVQGGESRAQENLINCIAEKERLVHTRAAVARQPPHRRALVGSLAWGPPSRAKSRRAPRAELGAN